MRRTRIGLSLLLAVAFLLLAGWVAVTGLDLLDREVGTGDGAPSNRHEAGETEEAPEARDLRLGGGGVSPDALAGDECGVLGQVLDARSGEPVAGVRVLALQWHDGHDAHSYGQALSDAEGRYRVRGVESGMTRLRLIACGGGWLSAIAVPSPKYGAMSLCTVALAPGVWAKHDLRVLPGATVRGTARLPDGRPAAGAAVHPEPFYVDPLTHACFPWDGVPSVTCDAEGRFAFDGLPPAEGVGFVAELDGYVGATSEELALAVGKTVDAAIRFDPPRRAALDVRAETGTPIAKAKVSYGWFRQPRYGDENYDAVVEAGFVALPLLPPWAFSIRIEAEGFVTFVRDGDAVWDDLLRPAGDGLWTGTVILEPVAYLSGRIERPDGFDKQPIHVAVKAAAAPGYMNYEAHAAVEADDTFRVPTPRAGTYALTLREWSDRRQYEAEAAVEAGTAGIVLRPVITKSWAKERTGRWARWRVRVLGQDGKPLGEADTKLVSCGKAEHAPGSDFELRPDDAGVVRLDVREDAYGAWLVVRTWTAQEGCPAGSSVFGPFGPEGGEVTVRMPPRRPVTGRLLTPDGAPIQGAALTATLAAPVGAPEDCSAYATLDWTWTDADGRFVLRRLADDDVMLEVKSAGTWPAPPKVRVAAGARDVEIRVLDRITCQLTVLGAGGVPVEGGWIILRQRAGARGEDAYDDDERLRRDIRPDGTVELTGLERGGTYDLRINAPGDLRELHIRAWTPRNQTFHLDRARAVAGCVLDADGRPVTDAVVALRDPDGDVDAIWSEADGRFRFPDVEDGTHRVWAFFRGARFVAGHPPLASSVEAEAGEESVELRLASLRDLRVRVPAVEGVDLSKHTLWLRRIRDPDGIGAHFELAPQPGGTGHFRGLEPDESYRLWFALEDRGLYALHEVAPGAEAIEVVLREGGVVEGHVTLPPNAKKARVVVGERGVRARADVRIDGAFTLRTLPAGAWTLEARCSVAGKRRAKRSPSPVRAGERVDFDLTSP